MCVNGRPVISEPSLTGYLHSGNYILESNMPQEFSGMIFIVYCFIHEYEIVLFGRRARYWRGGAYEMVWGWGSSLVWCYKVCSSSLSSSPHLPLCNNRLCSIIVYSAQRINSQYQKACTCMLLTVN